MDHDTEDARRLELLKGARHRSGRTLDFWADLTDGLPIEVVERLTSRAGLLAGQGAPARG